MNEANQVSSPGPTLYAEMCARELVAANYCTHHPILDLTLCGSRARVKNEIIGMEDVYRRY